MDFSSSTASLAPAEVWNPGGGGEVQRAWPPLAGQAWTSGSHASRWQGLAMAGRGWQGCVQNAQALPPHHPPHHHLTPTLASAPSA